MSGYGPPRGWRGSNAWSTASPQRTEEPMSETERTELAEKQVAELLAECAELKKQAQQSEAVRLILVADKFAAEQNLRAAIARTERAEAALAEMRERLGVQWVALHADRKRHIEVDDEASAHKLVACLPQDIGDYTVASRLVGEWRVADATPRTALERAADEQGDGEG